MNETTNGYDDIQEAGGLDTTEDVAHITDSEQKENASSEMVSMAIGSPEMTGTDVTLTPSNHRGDEQLNPRSGLNEHEPNLAGIHEETNKRFDEDGFDSRGRDREGYDKFGFDKNGVHKTTGTELDEDGFYRSGIHATTGTRFAEDGFKRNGRDQRGYDRDGWLKSGKNRRGFYRNGIHYDTGTRYDLQGFDIDKYDEDGFNRRGFDRSGHMKVDEESVLDIKNVLGEFIDSDLTVPLFAESHGITVTDFDKMIDEANQQFPELAAEAIDRRNNKNKQILAALRQDTELLKSSSMTVKEFFEKHPRIAWEELMRITGPEERRYFDRKLVSSVIDGGLEPEDVARIFTTNRYNFGEGLKDFRNFKSNVFAKGSEFEKLDKFWKRMRNFHEKRSLQGLVGMKITIDDIELIVDDNVVEKAVEYAKQRGWLICEGRVNQAIHIQMIEPDNE